MQKNVEIELKLLLGKRELKKLLASDLLKGVLREGSEKKRNLVSSYYDTADLAFKKNGVAIVDVSKIVAGSKQVKALKDEQTKKNAELNKWLETARADVAKQQTEAGKEKLLKKYEADLAKKREANAKEYAKKLADIDKSISDTIAAQAKAKGYDVVLSKSVVLYGGYDLTAEIAKAVK